MSPLLKGMVTAAAVVAGAGAGLWAGQTGLVKLPISVTTAMTGVVRPETKGPVIYYRDPDGKPLYSPTPKTTEGGQPYVAVYAGEDAGFDTPKPDATEAAAGNARAGRAENHPLPQPHGPSRCLAGAEEGLHGDGLHPRLRRRRGRRRHGQGLARQDPAHRRQDRACRQTANRSRHPRAGRRRVR